MSDDLFAELQRAKDHVRWLLDHADGNVDCHGLDYWAHRVTELRKQIKERL